MKISLTPSLFKGIIGKYSLDVVFMLKLVEKGVDLASFCEGAKLTNLFQLMLRKGLMNDEGTQLTTMGKELLALVTVEWEEGDDIITDGVKRVSLTKPKSTDFDEWWALYPASDAFELRGKTFKRTRTLKVDPDGCRIKFDKILLEGKYSLEEMKKAIEMEVRDKQERSMREGKNCLTFMVGSSVYLNQRRYEPYIEDIRKGICVENETENRFDGINI